MTRRGDIAAITWIVIVLVTSACGARSSSDVGPTGIAAGAGGEGGTTGSSGGAGGTSKNPPCTTAKDCDASDSPCAFAACNDGVCGRDSLAEGTLVMKDAPPDCHVTVCDGMGHMKKQVDTSNVPEPDSDCLVGSCDVTGLAANWPVEAGTACNSTTWGTRCDGQGHCVGCLGPGDCSLEDVCTATHFCVSPTCLDGAMNETETDVDCGGGCPPCKIDLDCLVDEDCISEACHSASLVCVADRCNDAHQNGDESDVDCGGSCLSCPDFAKCEHDVDCVSDACDQKRRTCLPLACIDGQKGDSETDVDCGGAVCPGCYVSKRCLLDEDCATSKCHPTEFFCFGNPCADQMQDGDESDVDCGGTICGPCERGEKCFSNFDCNFGLCFGGICQ